MLEKMCALQKRKCRERMTHQGEKRKDCTNRRVRKTLVLLCLNSITTQDASIQIPKKEKGDTRTCKDRPDLIGCEKCSKKRMTDNKSKKFCSQVGMYGKQKKETDY